MTAVIWAAIWAALLVTPGAHAERPPCEFRTSSALNISFGTLDPRHSGRVIASTRDAIGDCPPGFRMGAILEQGRHFANGSQRLKHAHQAAYLPYSLSLRISPPTGRGPGFGQFAELQITAVIEAGQYANLPAGDYADDIVLVIKP